MKGRDAHETPLCATTIWSRIQTLAICSQSAKTGWPAINRSECKLFLIRALLAQQCRNDDGGGHLLAERAALIHLCERQRKQVCFQVAASPHSHTHTGRSGLADKRRRANLCVTLSHTHRAPRIELTNQSGHQRRMRWRSHKSAALTRPRRSVRPRPFLLIGRRFLLGQCVRNFPSKARAEVHTVANGALLNLLKIGPPSQPVSGSLGRKVGRVRVAQPLGGHASGKPT